MVLKIKGRIVYYNTVLQEKDGEIGIKRYYNKRKKLTSTALHASKTKVEERSANMKGNPLFIDPCKYN